MAKKDYYEILGVSKDADSKALKAAYRKFAMKYHPDRNPDDAEAEANFKRLNEAYDVLKDEQKRAAYDRFGHAAFEQGGQGARGGAGGFHQASGFSDVFEDIFGDFMGGGGARAQGGAHARAQRGSDLRYNLSVSLEEAFTGVEKEITVPTSVACKKCHGSGAKKGEKASVCSTCRGAGKVHMQQGFFTVEQACPSCHGAGSVIKNPCAPCSGAGRVNERITLKVKVPQGIDDGTRIRLSGKGQAGLRGAAAGDLYLFIHINEHPIFIRDGYDLHCRIPIPMTQAALGGHLDIYMLNGKKVRITLPEGTQTGHQFRLRDKGMPVLNHKGRAGDLYVEVQVETPVKLSKKQKELLQAFEESSKNSSPESAGFLKRMKDLFS